MTFVPGGSAFKACNSQKGILSRTLVFSSLFTSFILFYVAYQRDLQPRGCAISHGVHKVPFLATIYVPPEQPKQLHFLNPNTTGDLTLQSWFSWLHLSRLTFLQAPPAPPGRHAVAVVTIITHSPPSLALASGLLAFSLVLSPPRPIPFPTEGVQVNVSNHLLFSGCSHSLACLPPPSSTCSFMQRLCLIEPQTACRAKHNSVVWPGAATTSERKHRAWTWHPLTGGLLSNVFRQKVKIKSQQVYIFFCNPKLEKSTALWLCRYICGRDTFIYLRKRRLGN